MTKDQRIALIVCVALFLGSANAIAARIWNWDQTTIFIVGGVCCFLLAFFGIPFIVLPDARKRDINE